ncbi:hypothetical protein Tco_1524633 [Tanacetum coccineum]
MIQKYTVTLSTPPTTTSIFGDEDLTIAQTLMKMKEEKAKEKGVAFKDVEDSSRIVIARSTLTLQPLPTIDSKDKGKGILKESPMKKLKRSDFDKAQFESDAELAERLFEEELAEIENERNAQEKASMDLLATEYDDVKARNEANVLFAAKLQEEERDQYTIEERARFLQETISSKKKFFAEQREATIRNKPPTRTQLRSRMMTLLKHQGNYKHHQLKGKSFEEIQVLYEKEKRFIDNFVSMGSVEEERIPYKRNNKATPKSNEKKRKKAGSRLKSMSKKQKVSQEVADSDSEYEKENGELSLHLKIAPDEDKEVAYEILDVRSPTIEWKSVFLGTKPQPDNLKEIEMININVVTRSDGKLEYSKLELHTSNGVHTLMTDTVCIHMLVEKKYHLIKEVLLKMLESQLETNERQHTMARSLSKFHIKKQSEE